MVMEWQKLSIPFIRGLDSGKDDRFISPPSLLVAENVEFDRQGAVHKRAGSAELNNNFKDINDSAAVVDVPITALRQLAARDGGRELLAFDDNYYYSYSPATSRWARPAPFSDVLCEIRRPIYLDGEQPVGDRVTSGAVIVYAFEISSTKFEIWYVDEQGGRIARTGVTGIRPRCLLVNGVLFVLYIDTAATALKAIRIDGFAGAVVLTTSFTLVTDVSGDRCYDTDMAGVDAVVAYTAVGGIYDDIGLFYLHSDGTKSTVQKVTAGSAVKVLAVAVEPNVGHVGVVYGDSTTKGFIRATDLVTVITAPTVILTGSPARCYAAVFRPTADASARYHLHGLKDVIGAGPSDELTQMAQLRSDGTVFAGDVWRHSGVASRAWRDNGQMYCILAHQSALGLQNSYFLVRVGANTGVYGPDFGTGIVEGYIWARVLYGTGGGLATSPVLPKPDLVSRKAYVVLAEKRRLTGAGGVISLEGRGLVEATFDFGAKTSHRTIERAGIALMPGGALWQFDGLTPVETSFFLWPERVTGVSSASGGGGLLVAGKTYEYVGVHEFTNARGQREQSFGVPISVLVGVGHDQVTITYETLVHTLKQDQLARGSGSSGGAPGSEATIAFYRSEADPTTDVVQWYRASAQNPSTAATPNGWAFVVDHGADTRTWVDRMDDATLRTNEILYLSRGELGHVAPGAASVACSWGGRIILGGGELGNQLRPSLQKNEREAPAFADELQIPVETANGAVTVLAAMHNFLVIGCERGIYIVNGDGPGNTGAGEAWPAPQLITTDMGMLDARSVVLTPAGLIFKTPGKGIQMLTASLGIDFVGNDVTQFDGEEITSAVMMPDSQTVRFLCASGITLVYDYFFKQWSVSTFGGVDADLYGGRYVYARSDGKVRKEDPTIFTDATVNYSLKVRIGWLHDKVQQGYFRCRRVAVLGEKRSGHRLNLTTYYDYRGDLPSTPQRFTEGAADGLPFQARFGMARQRGQAITWEISDDTWTGTGEGPLLTEMTVEIGTKTGIARLPASRSL